MRKNLIAVGIILCLTAFSVGQNKTYTVQKGENDETIAKKAHLTVHQLHLLNPNRNWLRLMPGAVLVIEKDSKIEKAQKLPSYLRTAVIVKRVIDKNDLGDISVVAYSKEESLQSQVSPSGTAKKIKTKTYVARQGDNDWVIAGRVGSTPHQIRDLNPDVDWNRLTSGTKLTVPLCGTKVTNLVAKAPSLHSKYAKISRDSVVIRRGPGVATGKVTTVDAGMAVTVLDKMSGWYKLKFPKGTVGWVRGDMLKAASRPMVASNNRKSSHSSYVAYNRRSRRHRSSEIVMGNPDGDDKVLSKAFAMRGTPYRYGQSSRSGVDCSGFSSLVYRSQGVRLPRTSRDQSRVGQKIDKGQLKKGDLVFFKTNRGTRINHVGIYVGNGKFIHASSGGGRVQVNSLSEGYYKRRYATARRVAGKKK